MTSFLEMISKETAVFLAVSRVKAVLAISPTDLRTIEPRLAEIFKTEEIINYGFWVLAKKLRA